MKIISHRGNIQGPFPEKENRPSYIDCALRLGYDVEVDVHWHNKNFWLGHDTPQYKIETSWLNLRKDKLWIHCKDQQSAVSLYQLNNNYKFFCHSSDNFVLTSTNQLWIHDLQNYIDDTCIIPLLDKEDILSYKNSLPFAICTDYVNLIQQMSIYNVSSTN